MTRTILKKWMHFLCGLAQSLIKWDDYVETRGWFGGQGYQLIFGGIKWDRGLRILSSLQQHKCVSNCFTLYDSSTRCESFEFHIAYMIEYFLTSSGLQFYVAILIFF